MGWVEEVVETMVEKQGSVQLSHLRTKVRNCRQLVSQSKPQATFALYD